MLGPMRHDGTVATDAYPFIRPLRWLGAVGSDAASPRDVQVSALAGDPHGGRGSARTAERCVDARPAGFRRGRGSRLSVARDPPHACRAVPTPVTTCCPGSVSFGDEMTSGGHPAKAFFGPDETSARRRRSPARHG